ncbi:MAG TPA: 2-oxoisovalerate dehydrogenase [Firmicutes bacterium]|nr:2-oxoisovalerate dehydrogenase [Bacillota bacterium]
MENEIIFVVQESDEGGYLARALGYPIFSEGDTLEEIRDAVRDAVRCHFDPGNSPKVIRLHFVKDEVIAV